MRKPPLSSSKETLASLFSRSSCIARSNSAMSSSISSGSGDISRSSSVRVVYKFVQEQSGNHVKRFKNALALVRARGEGRYLHFAIIQQEFHVFDRRRVGQVALVVLHHVRNVPQILVQAAQILLEVGETLYVLLHLLVLRVRHEHDAIDPAQHQLPRRVVN